MEFKNEKNWSCNWFFFLFDAFDFWFQFFLNDVDFPAVFIHLWVDFESLYYTSKIIELISWYIKYLFFNSFFLSKVKRNYFSLFFSLIQNFESSVLWCEVCLFVCLWCEVEVEKSLRSKENKNQKIIQVAQNHWIHFISLQSFFILEREDSI